MNHSSDSGVDLYVTEDVVFKPGETIIVDLKVKSRMVDSMGNTLPYYLYPRSSISKHLYLWLVLELSIKIIGEILK